MSPYVYWPCRTSWGLFLLARSFLGEFLLAWGHRFTLSVEPCFLPTSLSTSFHFPTGASPQHRTVLNVQPWNPRGLLQTIMMITIITIIHDTIQYRYFLNSTISIYFEWNFLPLRDLDLLKLAQSILEMSQINSNLSSCVDVWIAVKSILYHYTLYLYHSYYI